MIAAGLATLAVFASAHAPLVAAAHPGHRSAPRRIHMTCLMYGEIGGDSDTAYKVRCWGYRVVRRSPLA